MPETKNEVKTPCACKGGVSLIFPCSGAADVGEIADRAARNLTARGDGKMFCLAGIGGNVSGIIASTHAAQQILAIDGCSLDCARKTLEQKDITRFHHLRLSDMGLEKSKSPASAENIAAVMAKGQELLFSCNIK